MGVLVALLSYCSCSWGSVGFRTFRDTPGGPPHKGTQSTVKGHGLLYVQSVGMDATQLAISRNDEVVLRSMK